MGRIGPGPLQLAALDRGQGSLGVDLAEEAWRSAQYLWGLQEPRAWTGHFRGSPMRWKPTDGQAVVAAIVDAKDHPITRPVDAAKLARRPRALKAAIGPVTVPDSTEEPELVREQAAEPRDPTAHTELQWSLLKLGNDMGLTSGSRATIAAGTGTGTASPTCPGSGPTFPCSSMRPPTGPPSRGCRHRSWNCAASSPSRHCGTSSARSGRSPAPSTRIPRRGIRIVRPGRRLASAGLPSHRIFPCLARSQMIS